MRVHACALRLLNSISHCPSLFPLSPEPIGYDVKVIGQAIYGVAFAFEDDDEVSDHTWTRHSKGISEKDVLNMEFRITQLFYDEGKGSLMPQAVSD